MKRIIGLTFAALIMICGLSSLSSAQTYHRRHSINARERYQQRRIAQGIRSGELTARESYRLEREQYRIRQQESRFRRSGGGLSQRERARLQREENQSSRRIYRQKHDRQQYRYRRP